MYLTKTKISLDSFIFHYVYVVVFFTIYILTNHSSNSLFLYTKLFNLLTTMILLSFLFYKLALSNFKLNINKIDFIVFFLIICIVLYTFISRQYINFHWIYLIFAYIYFYHKDIQLNQKFKKIVLTIVFVAVIYQLITIRFDGVRPVINWYDPNYSGFFIFVLFLFLRYEKMRIMSYIILFVGFLTLSRAYILAVLIYFVFTKISLFVSLIRKFRLNRFFVILFISFMPLFFIESYFISQDSRLKANTSENKNLYEVADASNQDRFTANVMFKEDLFNNLQKYQFGVALEDYTTNVFRNTPHNSFYTMIINYGIYFTILYFIIFAKIYNRFFNKQNIAIIISLFSYYMLLGAGIQGYPGLLIFYLLFIHKGK